MAADKAIEDEKSQSTIKMDKGYYLISVFNFTIVLSAVAIHNKNGQGLLQVDKYVDTIKETGSRNPQ